MVPGRENVGNWLALEYWRPGVLRIFEQTVRKTFLGGGRFLAHHAGQQPHAGIEQRQRGNLAAREHEIAERHLLQPAGLDQPFIDAFETGADNNRAEAVRQFRHAALREPNATGTHQQARARVVRNSVKCACEDISLHDHSGAAAGRGVVDGAMLVGCVRTDVDRVE